MPRFKHALRKQHLLLAVASPASLRSGESRLHDICCFETTTGLATDLGPNWFCVRTIAEQNRHFSSTVTSCCTHLRAFRLVSLREVPESLENCVYAFFPAEEQLQYQQRAATYRDFFSRHEL